MKRLLEDSTIFVVPDEEAPIVEDFLNEGNAEYEKYDHPHDLINDWYAQLYLMGGSNKDNREGAAAVTLANYGDFRDRKIKHLTESRTASYEDFEAAAKDYVNEHYTEDEKKLSGWN